MTRYEIGPCPACSGSAHRVIADAPAVREEVEQLWAFHTRRLRDDTPPDRLHDRITFSQDPPLRIVCCSACGLLFRNPREKQADLVQTYRDEQPDHAALEALFENQKAGYCTQARRLTRILGGTGTGLEIGSYIGAFLAAARQSGWTFEGLDVSAAANAFARSRGLAAQEGTIERAPGSTRYDAVAFWNCFEQLPDPRAAARAARERLRAGGLIAIRVPNGAFYTHWRAHLHAGRPSPIRGLARALLAHNNLLTFPYRSGFTTHSLHSLLEASGFRVERTFGDTLVPVADEWTLPWARAEERMIKAALRLLPPPRAPWIETYALAI